MWLSVAFLLVIVALLAANAAVRWARTSRSGRELAPSQPNGRPAYPDVFAAVVVGAAAGGY